MQTIRDPVGMRREGEAGYSWLYRATALNGGLRIATTILVIALAAGVFAWYSRSQADASPDSVLGYAYASIGTLLMLLAAISFSMRRRSHHKRTLGGLRSALGWHMCFGIMGMAFLSMHSFGQFNPRTGTYALYGMVAMVISGLIGRFLDRLMPRMIAGKVHQILTPRGEDRIEEISQNLQTMVVHNRRDLQGFTVPRKQNTSSPGNSLVPVSSKQVSQWAEPNLHTPWDLAYISLESTPQELHREAREYRFVPDQKSALLAPGALMPGTQDSIEELRDVQQAMGQELFYRYVTRYWRRFHIFLALVTVGLLVWHVVYAAQLLLPTLGH